MILQKLNLNLDSFVFLDDSEFKINLVKKYCKNVISFKVLNIKKYPLVINKIKNLFDIKTHTEEDKKKFLIIRKTLNEKNLKENFDSIDDYLKKIKD